MLQKEVNQSYEKEGKKALLAVNMLSRTFCFQVVEVMM